MQILSSACFSLENSIDNCPEVQWWFVSYVCLLTVYWVIITNELQCSQLFKSNFSFFKLADIRALCILLNFVKYCSHWKEISFKKNPYKVYWRLLFYVLVVSHFPSNSWSLLSYSYVAVGQYTVSVHNNKKRKLHDKNVLVVLGCWWRMQINWNYISQ